MSLLLDTHVVPWAIAGDATLGEEMLDRLRRDPDIFLPPHHRDPFDRMLVAQATVEGLTLASRDGSIARYDVDILKV